MVRNWLPPVTEQTFGQYGIPMKNSVMSNFLAQWLDVQKVSSMDDMCTPCVEMEDGNVCVKSPWSLRKKNRHRIDWIKSRFIEVNSATSWRGLRTHLPALMFHVRTCTSFLIWFNILVVGPRSWRILFESPDRLASMTQTTIFTDNEQCHKWADELINILLQSAGHKFGKMTSCFFSNCCGYEYAHNSVKPTRIPRVLYDMMAHLMPHCGMSARELWPTGINVNYYPDG